MGKKSRLKRDRRELMPLLREQVRYLVTSSIAYDYGDQAEAKRLAGTVRVLLHDTSTSHSLLGQMGLKDTLQFMDSAPPDAPGNLLPYQGLVHVIWRASEEINEADFRPHLDSFQIDGPRHAPFKTWWTVPVLTYRIDFTKGLDAPGNRGTMSRRGLTLEVANTDGAAHIDEELDAAFVRISRENSSGWGMTEDGGLEAPVGVPGQGRPFPSRLDLVCVRQIAHEVVRTVCHRLPADLGGELARYEEHLADLEAKNKADSPTSK